MKNHSLEIDSLEVTRKIGTFIGRNAFSSSVICLEGDLGAGKTTLAQFIGAGLDVDEYITSPSFAILHEYTGRIPFYHMDFYRLGSSDEVIDLGFEELFYGEGLCVIEWFSRAEDIIPEDHLKISLTNIDEVKREVVFTYPDESKWSSVIETLFRDV